MRGGRRADTLYDKIIPAALAYNQTASQEDISIGCVELNSAEMGFDAIVGSVEVEGEFERASGGLRVIMAFSSVLTSHRTLFLVSYG